MNFLAFICVVLVIVPGWIGVFLCGRWIAQKYDKYEDAIVYAVVNKPMVQAACMQSSISDSSTSLGVDYMITTAEYFLDVIKKKQMGV